VLDSAFLMETQVQQAHDEAIVRLLIIAAPQFPQPRLRFGRHSSRHSEAITGQRNFPCIIVEEKVSGATYCTIYFLRLGVILAMLCHEFSRSRTPHNDRANKTLPITIARPVP
jgi:hypothetical protein